MTRRAAFLDRDGVLNVRPPAHDYVRRIEDFVWIPGAPEAVALLMRGGFMPIVVSNQRGVARGLLTEQTLQDIEKKIEVDLEPFDARIADFFYCVHDYRDECECRKPKPGLLFSAAALHDVELAESVMFGDAADDIAAGLAAGCKTVLIGCDQRLASVAPDSVAPNLLAAARLMV